MLLLLFLLVRRACVSGFVSGTHAIFQVYLLLDLTITFYFTTFSSVFRAYFMHTSYFFCLFLCRADGKFWNRVWLLYIWNKVNVCLLWCVFSLHFRFGKIVFVQFLIQIHWKRYWGRILIGHLDGMQEKYIHYKHNFLVYMFF